ncbi:hypothetical protein CgunFtcFv8_005783 [Champsocephalus gunnari]|uniref:Uncharacterized protein n=1 Tax=Champsocephalus gunnari TaxID=52237 RepID=A0AAN8D0Y7_CHAGU|nr:hypothetical protein CgunFtcFv8_005783 [Champsocephalus gunnari]
MQAPSRQRGGSGGEVEGGETSRGKATGEGGETSRGKATGEGGVHIPSSHQKRLCIRLGRRVGEGRSSKDRSWPSKGKKIKFAD